MSFWLLAGVGFGLMAVIFLSSPPAVFIVLGALSLVSFYKGAIDEGSQ